MNVEDTLIKAIDNRIDVAINEKMKFDRTYLGVVKSINEKQCVVTIGGN